MEMQGVLRHVRTRWRGLSRQTAWLTIGIALVLALLVLEFSWERCFFDGCPDVSTLAAYQPGGAPVILDRHGEVFADLTPVEQKIVPLGSLPSHVAEAFLAVEDQRFYAHNGVDLRRVGGALLANLRSGGFDQGFSTISMQLARNVFPDRIPGQEQSLARKALEVRVAREIEHRYSKQEILELYLNHIYFGNRAHGIEAAAQQYFRIPATQLSLTQAALLAALPKAPSYYDPRRHPERALERRNLVLKLLEDQGRVPHLQALEAQRSPLGMAPPPRQERVESGLAPYFVEQVRHELEERFGADLYRRPLRIRTTLDSRVQRAAEEELARQLRLVEDGELGSFQGPRYMAADQPPPTGTPYVQGAVVMLDAVRGDVLAWVGGRNFAHSQFDRVSQARRQAGSAFKPFVYAAALRDGWVLSQPLLDQPLRVRLASGQVWRPRNFTNEYEGQITVRDALVRSKNVPTVRLADAIGLREVADTAREAGIDERFSVVPAMALGTVAVSPLELSAAYTAFAGLGEGVEPRYLLDIQDLDGKVLWSSSSSRRKVLDPGVAFLITDVLAEALERGTGYRVRQAGVRVPAAGKTGTTNDGADAWFVGYTPEVVAGVWIGFDKPRPILEDATGGRLAAPLWARLVQRFHEQRRPPQPWKRPAGVVVRKADPATGLRLEDGCAPLRGEAYDELFLQDYEPKAYCPGKEPVPQDGFPTIWLANNRRLREEEERRPLAQKAEQADEARKQAEQEQLTRQAAARRQAEQQAARETEERERLAQERQARDEEARHLAQQRETAQKKAEERQVAAEAQRKEEEKAGRLAQTQRPEELRRERAERQAKEVQETRAEQERLARLQDGERRLVEKERELRRREERLSKERKDPESRRAEPKAEEPKEETKQDEDAEEDREEEPRHGLSGWWEMTNRIDSTNYASFKGLRLGYRVQLEQDGNRITGRGQKWAEDGRTLPASARTPIRVTGSIDGGKITLQFTEQGAKRSTSGGFTWTLSADRTELRGSFWSTAAGTSGKSTAVRMP